MLKSAENSLSLVPQQTYYAAVRVRGERSEAKGWVRLASG